MLASSGSTEVTCQPRARTGGARPPGAALGDRTLTGKETRPNGRTYPALLAAPVLPRLGPLAVTIYACALAGVLLLAAAALNSSAGGPPILRTPTPTRLAALSYLAVAVTAVVFLAWYAAMRLLGVDRGRPQTAAPRLRTQPLPGRRQCSHNDPLNKPSDSSMAARILGFLAHRSHRG